MNDMTRQPSAARLSEDIGDVLSAIRRLIAEDEALSTARDHREEERAAHFAAQPAVRAAGGEVLAGRYGGNAALARRMALGTTGRRPHAVEEGAPGESGEAMAARRHAEETEETEAHPFEAAFDSLADDPSDFVVDLDEEGDGADDFAHPAGDEAGIGIGAVTAEVVDLAGEPAGEPVLRLRDSDRVTSLSGAAGSETSAEWNRLLPWRDWTTPQIIAAAPVTLAMFVPDTVPVEPVMMASPTVTILEDDDLGDDVTLPLAARDGAADPIGPRWAGTTEDDAPAEACAMVEAATEAPEPEVAVVQADAIAPHEAVEAGATVPGAETIGENDASPVAHDLVADDPVRDARCAADPVALVPVGEHLADEGRGSPDAIRPVIAEPIPVEPPLAEARPVPAAVLRPRASRWARIEPPVTRQRATTPRRDPAPAAPLIFATPAPIPDAAPLAMAAPAPTTEPSASLSEPVIAVTDPIPDAAPSISVMPAEPPSPRETGQAIPLAVRLARSLRGEKAGMAASAPIAPATATTEAAPADTPLPEPPTVRDDAPVAASEGAGIAVGVAVEAMAQDHATKTQPRHETPALDAAPDDVLRDLVRLTIQEELQGELGHRFARNLRAVIRREVAAALDSQLDRL